MISGSREGARSSQPTDCLSLDQQFEISRQQSAFAMPSIRPPSRRLLVPAFFMLVTIAAFLPVEGAVGRVYQRIVSPLHSTVAALVAPVSRGFTWVGSALRFDQQPVAHGGDVPDLHRRIEWLRKENVRLRGEVQHLRQQTRMLQRLPDAVALCFASVTGSDNGAGTRSRKIDAGRQRFGIEPGQAVAWEANLVGRISRADRLTAVVERIHTPGTLLDAVLTPADFGRAGARRGDPGPIVQLEAVGPMRFAALADKDIAADVGDLARLNDAAWPHFATGLIIGRVTAIEPTPEQPLKKRVMVQCMIDLPALGEVAVLVPQREAGPGANQKGGGGP